MSKESKNGSSLSSALLRKWIDRASPGGERGNALIVKYHRTEVDYGVSGKRRMVDQFDTQVALLSDVFNTLTVTEAARHIKDGTLPPRALCITFDDGYADNFEVALPILKRYGLKATFFVPSGLLDGSTLWSDQIASVFMTAGEKQKEVRQYLADAGMPLDYAKLMDKLKYMSVDASRP